MNFHDPIDQEDGWKLLEQVSINDRTLIAWYNPEDGIISLMIGHLTDQPNELSKRSPYTTWGYITHVVTGVYTCEEAGNVVSLYLQDMESEKYWWESA